MESTQKELISRQKQEKKDLQRKRAALGCLTHRLLPQSSLFYAKKNQKAKTTKFEEGASVEIEIQDAREERQMGMCCWTPI